MGNASIQLCLKILHLKMKLQVMCDPASGSPNSFRYNGEEDSTPVIAMAPKFEDVERLKADLSVDSQDQNLLDGSEFDNENEIRVSDSCSTKLLGFDSNDDSLHVRENESLPRAIVGASNCLLSSEESIHCNDKSDENKQDQEITSGRDYKPYGGSISSTYQSCAHDLPIDVSSSSSARFSRVLENISLPLLYIPTTKQLVANKTTESISREEQSKTKDVDEIETGVKTLCNDNTNVNPQPVSTASGVHEPHEQEGRMTKTRNCSTSSLSDIMRLQHVENNPDYIGNRCDTYHVFPDNTSLSSLSTCTDFSVSAFSIGEDTVENNSLSYTTDDANFTDVNLYSRNSFDRTYNPLAIEDNQSGGTGKESQNSAPKKKTSTFKNIFGKKVKDDSTPGWKFFGRIPPKVVLNKEPEAIKSEIEARRQKTIKEKTLQSTNSSRKAVSEVLSTTALILENRPQNLPTKNPEEEERHRQQYIEMIEAAKRKEQKDLKQKKKHLQQQRKLEDKLMTFAQTWTTNILPNWDSMRPTKKVRDLWWLGLPSNVRGQVWTRAVGNDLNITHELYEICNKRAENKVKIAVQSQVDNKISDAGGAQDSSLSHDKEDSVNVIRLDVSRTFPHLGIFQKGGPYHDLLHSLLGAYACYRPDVGYVQGMSFIAAILLLNMEVADAFVCFANLLNRPCQLAFFRMDENIMSAYYETFDAFFKDNLPRLHFHVVHHNVTPNLYLMEWVFLLYSKSLPLDVACRVWDLFCRDGEEFLFRAAIGILKLYENVLLKMDFIHMAQFLTKLPEDISSEDLFHQLEGVRMNIDKQNFNAVYAFYRDLHESGS